MAVEFLSEALEDIFATATDYEKKQGGLGERFVSSVGRVASHVESFPRSGAPVAGAEMSDGEQRRCRLREFPYVLFYEVLGEADSLRLVVFAVVHERRAPRTWEPRTS